MALAPMMTTDQACTREDGDWRAVVSAVIIGSLAPVMLGVAPVLVGAMVTRMGFTPSQAGSVISAHLGGIGLMGLPMCALVNRPIWRPLLAVAFPALVAFFIVAGFISNPVWLALILFGAGLAGGVAVSITLPIMSRSRNPTAAFAWWVVLQLAFGACGVAIMPTVIASVGLGGAFWLLAAVMALMGLLTPLIPRGGAPASQEISRRVSSEPLLTLSGVIGLLGLFLFYVAVGGAWTYFERVGDAAGLNAALIAATLSIATLCGVGGALLAALVPTRLAPTWLAEIGAAVLLIALTLVLGRPPAALYGTSAVLFKVSWTFTLPFLLALLARVERSGRLLVLANIVIGLGLATGPLIAAAVVHAGDFSGAVKLAMVGVVGCGASFFWLSRRLERGV